MDVIDKPLSVDDLELQFQGKTRDERQEFGIKLCDSLTLEEALDSDPELPLWIALNSNSDIYDRRDYSRYLEKNYDAEIIDWIESFLNVAKMSSSFPDTFSFQEQKELYDVLLSSKREAYTKELLKRGVYNLLKYFRGTNSAKKMISQIKNMNRLLGLHSDNEEHKLDVRVRFDEYTVQLARGEWENEGGIQIRLYKGPFEIQIVGGYLLDFSWINQVQGTQGLGDLRTEFQNRYQVNPADLLVALFYSISGVKAGQVSSEPFLCGDTHESDNDVPYKAVAKNLGLEHVDGKYVITPENIKRMNNNFIELHDFIIRQMKAQLKYE